MATKFITISVEIMHDNNLTHSQKFILAEIEQLASLEKGCIASNEHFAQLIGIAKESVSRSINDLRDKGYIEIEIVNGSRNHTRIITVNNLSTLNKTSRPPKQNIKTPLTKHQETKENKQSNTTVNKTIVTTQSEEDSLRIANYLLNNILKHNPTFKKPKIESWAKDIDKAIRLDKRTVEQLKDCIDWIYKNEKGSFWISNILSGKKLREKFDTMNSQVIATKPTKKEEKLSKQAEATVNYMREKGFSEAEIAEEVGKML